MGRKIELRHDWEDIKIEIMRYVLEQKFAVPELKEKLRATHPYHFIERNSWHDQFWGDCECAQHKDVLGENNLGKLFMEVRDKK